MAENQWGDEPAVPARKRVPKWVWWTCGSGCLVALLIAVAFVILIGTLAHRAMDPEHAWKELAEILPYDKRPEGWVARGTMIFLGVGQYYLVPPEPTDAVLLVQRFHGRAELDALFDPQSAQNKGLLIFEEIREPEVGTITVQGREVRCLRFLGKALEASQAEHDGAHVRIDVTGSGAIPVCVQVAVSGELARVPDERVEALLAPFDLWRGR